MVFDFNRMMKHCSFWWLDWDGNAFVKGRRVIRAYIWAMFVWVLLVSGKRFTLRHCQDSVLLRI